MVANEVKTINKEVNTFDVKNTVLVSKRRRVTLPQWATAWLVLIPALLFLTLFMFYPIINTFLDAFIMDFKYIKGGGSLALGNFISGVMQGKKFAFGFGNFAEALQRTDFLQSILNTGILVIIEVPLTIIVSLLIATFLNNIKVLKGFYQTIFFLPYVTNTIAVGMVFSVLFDTDGVINFIFGIDKTWIYGADRWDAMVPLMIYIVWNALPFKILILLSGLQGIDKQYYQAAQIDSAPKSKVLTKITVPLLSPQILYILVTSFMGAFKEYTSVVGLFNGPGTMGKGEPNMETIVYYIYDNMADNTSLAAAAAVFLFIIILIFTALQFYVGKKRVHY